MDDMCSSLFWNLTTNMRQTVCKQWFEDTLERCSTLSLMRTWFEKLLFGILDVKSQSLTCHLIMRKTVEDYIDLVPLYNDELEKNLWLWTLISSATIIFGLKLVMCVADSPRNIYSSKREAPTVIFKSPADEFAEDHCEAVIDKLKWLYQQGAHCRVTFDFAQEQLEIMSETSSQGVAEVEKPPRAPAKSRSKPVLTLKTRSKWRI
jgi:hypothetical protein